MNHRPVFQTMGRIALALALVGTAARPQEAGNRELSVTVSKSVIVDSPVNIQRISVANGALAEAVAITPREVVVNGIAAGETSLIIWQEGGNRLIFDMKVLPIILPITAREVAIKQEMAKEFGPDVNMDVQGSDIFLRGTVKDMYTAERALTIAGTLGKPVNLLNVKVPQVEPQILLKVRFADVDRGASQDLGMNLFSTGAANTVGTVSTGGNSPPQPTAVGSGTTPRFTLTDALNV
ncbi:MAG: pilus assembly protein N-terminal domain-containing protein, partial [Acidobacteriia bacterium]|nr:pilus assembly protein N-terminal domain-containing protein [Terriglobia bacterium]